MATIREESYGIVPLMHKGDDWKVFVILHKHGNHWGFPKGKPDDGEDPKQSASRELFEETGLKVERYLIEQLFVESYTFSRNGKKVEKVVTYFPAIVSGAFLLQPEEIRDGKWMSFDEALKQLTFEEARGICRKTIACLNS